MIPLQFALSLALKLIPANVLTNLKAFGGETLKYLLITVAVLGGILGGGYFYGQSQYQKGLSYANDTHNQALIAALDEQKRQHDIELDKLKKRNVDLEKAKIVAEEKAQKSRRDAEKRFSQLEDIAHANQSNIQTTVYPFTVTFVGLHNIALESTDEDRPITPADIVSAARLDPSITGARPSDPTTVSVYQALRVNLKNAKILRQCLDERKTMQEWFASVCADGSCNVDSSMILQLE